ncbi:hypothetical protein ABMA58_20710, partial [Oceanospirillum sp. HFRX-1_2]
FVFVAFVIIALAIDLYAHKKDEPIPLKSAVIWSIFWVGVAMLFAGYLNWSHGPEMSSLFISGYVLEKTLSVDNLFVIAAIMSWFAVPPSYFVLGCTWCDYLPFNICINRNKPALIGAMG